MNYYDEKTFGELLKEFTRCMSLKIEELASLPGFEKDNAKLFFGTYELDVLSDEQITSLQRFLDSYIKSPEYQKNLGDDEEEYCWNMAKAMIRKCENTLLERNPEKQNERTSR